MEMKNVYKDYENRLRDLEFPKEIDYPNEMEYNAATYSYHEKIKDIVKSLKNALFKAYNVRCQDREKEHIWTQCYSRLCTEGFEGIERTFCNIITKDSARLL